MKEKRPKSTLQSIKAFEELIRRDAVVSFVREYRKYLDIPPDGLQFTDEDKKAMDEDLLKGFWYIPKRIFPLSAEAPADGTTKMRIINTCNALVGSEGYNSLRMGSIFRLYFLFNQIIDSPMDVFNYEDDLLRIEHLPTELADYDNEDHFLLTCMHGHFEGISKKYPVAVYLNPEATLNQVKDFLSKKWPLIQSYRGDTKPSYAGKRRKPRQAVNDFVYNNRALSIAEIRSKLANEMKEYLDDGHVGKILSLEKKKRN